jgi:hypothetical protein
MTDTDIIQATHAPSPPRCFLHIPKSGGASVHAALEEALPGGSLAPRRMDTSTFCDFRDFELLKPVLRDLVAANRQEIQALRRYRAVSGHFSLPTMLQITVASAIGTVVREPRARLISLYLYWRTPKIFDAWLPYSIEKHVLRPLDQFLGEPRVAAATDNQMCRMLLHGDARIPSGGFIASRDIDAIASEAISKLDTLGFVGVLELGDRMWKGLARLFDVELEPKILNATGDQGTPIVPLSNKWPILTNMLDLLARRSAADRIVYDHALTLAGVDKHERLRLTESAFAGQLIRMGDLIGASAAALAERNLNETAGASYKAIEDSP